MYLSTVPLICRMWVGFHNPNRCVRQFGGIQRVPEVGLALTLNSWNIHVTDRYNTKKSAEKWRRDYLEPYVNMWNNRYA